MNLDHIIVSYGRFNPPTRGHEILVNKVLELAKFYNCNHEILVSHSQDSVRNPLNVNRKLYYLKLMSGAKFFPTSKELPSVIEHLKIYSMRGYKTLTYVCGFDRMDEFKNLITKYNGKEYNFNKIDFIESGNLETREQYSATDLREYIRDNMFIPELFPKVYTKTHSKNLYDEILNIFLNKEEEINLDY